MNIVYVVLFVIILLFVLAYRTRRRFGVLGLALCAGSLLSTMWTASVTSYATKYGLHSSALPLSSIVSAVLILLPALFLLYGGPTYSKRMQRIIGAAAFALLASAFLLAPLGSSLSLDDMGTFYYDIFLQNRDIVITVAVVYALFDILVMRLPSKKK